MSCDDWREQISARADGERTARSPEAIDRHLAGCPACRSFAAALGSAPLLEVVDMPDLARAVTREVAREDRRAANRLLRAGLVAVAAIITWGAVPRMLGEQRVAGSGGAMFHAPVNHDVRHAGAFSVAFAVGLLLVALRPARARALFPVALMAAAALVVTAVLDAVEGQVTILSERQHLPELAALLLIWLLARSTSRRPADEGRREPGLRVVDDEAAAS